MYLFFKRVIDLLIAIPALAILTPLLIPIVILLKLTGEGYVFYYQKRIGYKCKEFNIIKFATMLKDSPNIGTGNITLRNDPRLLPMGKFLRMTKINELPQLLNVLFGDMSIVGPRPLVPKVFNYYPDSIGRRIYEAKPGITGIGSVFFRDEEKLISNTDLPAETYYKSYISPYKGALELWYITNRSIRTDFIIMFLTAWVILFSKTNLMYRLLKGLPDRTLFSLQK